MTEMHESAISVPGLTLGWRLQMALRHGNVSVQQMADQLGVRRQTLSRWTGDHGAPPKRAYITQWALATGVPVEWLETGVSAPSDPPGADITTRGYTPPALICPGPSVNRDAPSSHDPAWQVVTPLTALDGSAQPWGAGDERNDQEAVWSRCAALHALAVEDIETVSKVAA